MSGWRVVSPDGTEHSDTTKLVASIADVFFGRPTQYKFAGSTEQAQALERAIFASQGFHSTLNCSAASLQSVGAALRAKNEAGGEFYRQTGVRWPL
jgi:hypothetical protein